jgi:hypothetical protein
MGGGDALDGPLQNTMNYCTLESTCVPHSHAKWV